MKLSIIIPVFNEEKTVPLILKKLQKIALPGVTFEIIVVNDASTDKTSQVIKRILNKHIKIVHHRKNLGKGAAIRTALQHANGDYVIIQDADMEYDPSFFPMLLEPIQKKSAQVVYGTRLNRLPNFKKEERTLQFFSHYLGNRVISLLVSTFYGQWLTDVETGYKVVPLKIIKAMNLQSERFEFEIEVTAKLLQKGHTIIEVPITTSPRQYKEGKKLRTIPDGFKALWSLFRYRFSSI